MPTPAQRAIALALDETGNNIEAVAQRLGLSAEYVRQQAIAQGKTSRNVGPTPVTDPTALVPAETSDGKNGSSVQPSLATLQQEFIGAILPQNTAGLVELRDTILEHLQAAAEIGAIPPRLQVSLLRLLLEHEAQLRAIARPALNLSVADHRTVDMTVLVEKLEGLPTDALAKLSKGKMPQIIDHE